MKKALLLSTLGVLLSLWGIAQEKKSYLYLEVNKNLPVQVKLNDKPLKNNNKGYIIVPRLPEGNNKLEFNFSNPNFKNHTFEFPAKSSSLGLRLARVSDNNFVLQDVVNKTIIRESSASNKVVSARVEQPAKTKSVKKGVIKTYTAKTQTKKRIASKKKIEKQVVKVKKTEQNQVAPKAKTYAMYKNRRPLTATNTAKRNKNYRKINREIRRKKKAQQVNSETPKATNKFERTDRSKKAGLGSIEPKQQRLKEQESKRQEQELKKQERLVKEKKREFKKQMLLKKEKEEYAALEKRREERRAARASRKKYRQDQISERIQADIPKTKKVKLPKKKKFYEKDNTAIGEKVINAEPIGNPSSQKNNGIYSNESTKPASNKCISMIRAEKVADWATKLHKKYDDEARSNYITRKLGSKCISNNNLGVLLAGYETQIGRYKLIKELYPQLENPKDVLSFGSYFKSKSYITKLKDLNFTDY